MYLKCYFVKPVLARSQSERDANELRRIADVRERSRKQTKTLGTFVMQPIAFGSGDSPRKLVLTDVSLRLHYLAERGVVDVPEKDDVLYFQEVRSFADVAHGSGKY